VQREEEPMTEETRQVVIAPRLGATPPPDWQEQLARTPGVTVLGSAFGRMQVRATPSAIQDASARLGHALHFEEVIPRGYA
jgi:hypothetical protein